MLQVQKAILKGRNASLESSRCSTAFGREGAKPLQSERSEDKIQSDERSESQEQSKVTCTYTVDFKYNKLDYKL